MAVGVPAKNPETSNSHKKSGWKLLQPAKDLLVDVLVVLIRHERRLYDKVGDEAVQDKAHQQRYDGHLLVDFRERAKNKIDNEKSCTRSWHLAIS